MKNKKLAIVLAIASLGLTIVGGVAYAEEAVAPVAAEAAAPAAEKTIGALPSTAPAVATAVAAAPNDNELQMFRFALEMEKEAFVKKSMALDPATEKKFMDAYYAFNGNLVKLNNKRLAIIADYAANFDKMTNAKADELAKAMFDFRTKRTALNAAYYKNVKKATSSIVAARAMQVENILQGAMDVAISSKLPLMTK
ncbi:hypothetical protein BCS42_05295 [Crenothrix sp. D3]|nr:hypothetical protein BCS42_05295 [Crenothrix sp. D3]